MTVLVKTGAGAVEGREKNGILLFAGIPFAAPPTGVRRFRPPEPHGGWEGVRDATRFGKVSVQVGDSLGSIGAAAPPDWSEDCLFLNVQTPAADDHKRPVMVWIHGGAFVNGTGAIPWYDGSKFVHHGDVVVVSINYRLGALGWLYLGHLDPEYRTSGNCGLLDQIAALEWVQQNIAAFGGDPQQVTVFGESAGAMSVGTLLGTPKAEGLFTRAIAQSGAAHHVSSIERSAVITDAFLKEFGTDDLGALFEAAPDRILAAQQVISTSMARGELGRSVLADADLPFTPVVDGQVLPTRPIDAVRHGSAAEVPVLTGTTAEEWNLFVLGSPKVKDDATLLRRVGRIVEDPDTLVAGYRQALGPVGPDEIFRALMTDRVFWLPAVRLVEAQSIHQPEHTFLYRFDVASSALDGRLGSCHALEIPFVFDQLTKAGVDLLTGPGAPQSVADDMHAAWIAFARQGSPGVGGLDWPAYGEDRQTMIFAVPSHCVNDPDAARRQAWEGLL
jgi:para-nitrobenzyl esterase